MWRYSDFLAVSEDFIPVFTEEVDKKYHGNWKSFIPHEQLRILLETLIKALERARGGDMRSIWLTGAYGTGKTYASFVVKHMLEDDLEAVEEYFLKHQILKLLWPRFRALRQGKRHLVIYRSSSGSITSSRRLMIEVQQAIKDQLRVKGYTNAFTAGLMDQLVSRLSDPDGVFNWEATFAKYRGRFMSVASAEEAIERLRNGDLRLGEQVAAVLEEEGLTLGDSPSDVKAWIKEVISSNNLGSIVFIWDEFTEFFANNVPVTPLQELAQATAEMPFYLFLVTHRALEQLRLDDHTLGKLLDRFHRCRLEMTQVTAYGLIANAINVHADMRDRWEEKLNSLWDKVDVAALQINLLGERVNKNELKHMVPIHPSTAYLLATISSLFSSSQRTLFQFLKTDTIGSFQWFIANHPQDNWYWLTPDYLWQYFFEDVKLENIEAISYLLSHYRSFKDKLNVEEVRVFCAILLLIALQRQTAGSSTLLKPRLSVLKHMFVGTDLYQRVEEVADGLYANGIVHAISVGNDREYSLPTVTIDPAKLNECRQRVKDALAFGKMIKAESWEGGFADELRGLLSLQGAVKLRHPIEVVSAKEFKLQRERILKGANKPYEVGVILVVAQEEEQLTESEKIAAEVSKNCDNYCILVSQIAFGDRRWNEWLDHKAYALYHEEMRDIKTRQYYDDRAKHIATEWLNEVNIGRIRAFFKGQQEELSGCEFIGGYLRNISDSVFPYGPEKLSQTATLYNPRGWGKAGALIGLGIAQKKISEPYKSLVKVLQDKGLWDAKTTAIDHPVARMQALVDSFFGNNDQVHLNEIWEALQRPPFGLMPSPIGLFLFAFLMRKYAQNYYYSDGVNSLPLNPDKLAELIEEVVRNSGLRPPVDYTIREISIHGEHFCNIAREIFQLPREQTLYPEEARKNVRSRIKEIGYPLWTLVYYAQVAPASYSVDSIERAVKALDEILSYSKGELKDSEMQAVVDAIEPARQELSRLLSRDRMQEGMKRFLDVHVPKLASLMSAIGLDVSDIKERLRGLLNEEVYLWREEQVKEKLLEIVPVLDLVDALNTLCGVKKRDLNEVRNYFRDAWFKGKLPLLCYKEGQTAEIAQVVDYLHGLIYSTSANVEYGRSDDIRRLSSQLVSLFSDDRSVLKMLVKKYTNQVLNEEETAALYDALPNLSKGSEEEVKNAIINELSRQVRQKKIAELRQYWQDMTSSASPSQWSEKKGVPIQWVLEGQAHHEFISRYENVDRLTEKDIDELINYLTEHTSEFALLQDDEYIIEKFLQVTAGEYADLVYRADIVGDLLAYIRDSFDGSVSQWPGRLSEIQRIARKGIGENYKKAYQEVRKVLDSISPDDAKQIIEEMAADDALVGARLLAILRRKMEGGQALVPHSRGLGRLFGAFKKEK